MSGDPAYVGATPTPATATNTTAEVGFTHDTLDGVELPYTGSDALGLAIIGSCAIAVGLALNVRKRRARR